VRQNKAFKGCFPNVVLVHSSIIVDKLLHLDQIDGWWRVLLLLLLV
jgi:hypothetical protein